MRTVINIIGERFDKVVVDSYAESRLVSGKKRRFYLVKCDCGKEKIVLGESLRSGACKSCGCLRKRLGSLNPKWKGCGEISGNAWNHIESRRNRMWGKNKRRFVFKAKQKMCFNRC